MSDPTLFSSSLEGSKVHADTGPVFIREISDDEKVKDWLKTSPNDGGGVKVKCNQNNQIDDIHQLHHGNTTNHHQNTLENLSVNSSRLTSPELTLSKQVPAAAGSRPSQL